MSRPPIDLARKIKDILLHTEPLPDEARSPILHYRRTGTDIWNALGYVEKALGGPALYRAVGDRHLRQLYGMALVNLVEAFERFESPGLLVPAEVANGISTQGGYARIARRSKPVNGSALPSRLAAAVPPCRSLRAGPGDL
jgi:hypothetical protein